MMYKGKRIDNNEEIKGYHCEIKGKSYIIDKGSLESIPETHPLPPHSIYKYRKVISGFLEVHPESVGQSTGLKETWEGKVEIYEKDKFKGKESGTIYTVVFKDGEYTLVYDHPTLGKEHLYCSLRYALNNSDIEMIK